MTMGVDTQRRTKAKVQGCQEPEDDRVQLWFSSLAMHQNHLGSYKISQNTGPSEIRISVDRIKAWILFKSTKLENHRTGAAAFLSNWVPKSHKMANCPQDETFWF